MKMKSLNCSLLLLSALAPGAPAQTNPQPAAGAQTIAIAVPPTATLVFAARGDGVQVYSCEKSGDNWIWQFKEPKATLFGDDGKAIGKHSAGPVWQLDDGSAIQGKLVATQPQVTAIPWLLLSAKQSGASGKLDAVKFVRRTDTVGGRAPSMGCDVQHAHAETSVPYSAKYSFYRDGP